MGKTSLFFIGMLLGIFAGAASSDWAMKHNFKETDLFGEPTVAVGIAAWELPNGLFAAVEVINKPINKASVQTSLYYYDALCLAKNKGNVKFLALVPDSNKENTIQTIVRCEKP